MNNDYMDEVLPRWQFCKEFLITQTEDFAEEFVEEDPEVVKKLAKIIEKIKKTKNAKDLEKILKKIKEDLIKIEKNLIWKKNGSRVSFG